DVYRIRVEGDVRAARFFVLGIGYGHGFAAGAGDSAVGQGERRGSDRGIGAAAGAVDAVRGAVSVPAREVFPFEIGGEKYLGRRRSGFGRGRRRSDSRIPLIGGLYGGLGRAARLGGLIRRDGRGTGFRQSRGPFGWGWGDFG